MSIVRRIFAFLAVLGCLFLVEGDGFQPPVTTASGPLYRVSVEFKGGKSRFALGEPIAVVVKIWNEAGFPVECPPLSGQADKLNYRVDLLSREVGKPSQSGPSSVAFSSLRAPGSGGRPIPPCSIQPGEFGKTTPFDLVQIFRLDQRGQFRIIYSRRLPNPMNRADPIDVQSAEVLFTIE